MDATLGEAAATYRVNTGLVDTFFTEVAKKLRDATESPPQDTPGASFVQKLLDAWSPAAQQWARSGGGSPYAPDQAPEARLPQGHGGQLAHEAELAPGTPIDDMQRRFQAGAFFREFADGRFGQGLVAVVQFRHGGDGVLQGSALVRSSGNPKFDAYVLETAPTAVETLSPPEHLIGVRQDGFRTVWSFEGRILYKRTKKPKDLTLQDAIGAAAMAALSAIIQTPVGGRTNLDDKRPTQGLVPFTGSFDEAEGEVGLVDLTQPRFHVRVKLLQVE
ncbi:MAG: TonB C-terminal domain-containing protein [Myxococcaceae bacterium]|nr:TonB C-terminal domain-containing protein [Myxococcaceae bacterium]